MFVPGNVSNVLLIINFYVHYASIRTVVSFAQSHASIAFDMLQDFSHFSKFVEINGIRVFNSYHLLFVPCIILEVSLLSADSICLINETSHAHDFRKRLCLTTGLQYITSQYIAARFLIFVSLIIVVLQYWQIFLHQFPQWIDAFRAITRPLRRTFHLSAVVLIFLQVLTPFWSVNSGLSVLIGWTIWLYAFVPTLVQKYAVSWTEKNTAKQVAHVAAYVRCSLGLIFFFAFANICFFRGILKAHLEITFLTIIVPMIFTVVYILTTAISKISNYLLFVILILSFLISYGITSYGLLSIGGHGSFLMIFTHIFTKV